MFGDNVVWVNFRVAKQDRDMRPLTLIERLELQSRSKSRPSQDGVDVITALHKPVLVRDR